MEGKELKNQTKKWIVFAVFFMLGMVFVSNASSISYDYIWNFHECQKVANGYQLYTEINCILGPAFYLLIGNLMKLFGTSFWLFDMVGVVVYAFIAMATYAMVQKINKTGNPIFELISLFFVLINAKNLTYTNYNPLVVLFILWIVLLEFKLLENSTTKKYHYEIGILEGILFLIKQNMGLVTIFFSVVYSFITYFVFHEKEGIRNAFRRLGSAFLVILIALIIMGIQGNLMAYFDLCFGSMLEFGSHNRKLNEYGYNAPMCLGILIGSCSMLPHIQRKREALVQVLYSCALFFMVVPLANFYHLCLAFYFSFFLIIEILNVLYEHQKEAIAKLIIVCFIALETLSFYKTFSINPKEEKVVSEVSVSVSEKQVIEKSTNQFLYNTLILRTTIEMIFLAATGITLIKEKPKALLIVYVAGTSLFILLGSFFAYQNVVHNTTPANIQIYQNHGFNTKYLNKVSHVVEYIAQKEKEGYLVIPISFDAAEYMVPLEKNHYKYDLLFNGNLGYHGVERILAEMKELKNVLFLKNKKEFWQESKKIHSYITQNLNKIDQIEDIEVYYQP